MRRPVVWLTLLFIASRMIIWLYLIDRGSDLARQKGFVEKIVDGQVPFRDFFPEYPPLVFLYTGIPALVDPSLDWYFPMFRVLTCAVDCGMWMMLLRGIVSPVARDGIQEPGQVVDRGTVAPRGYPPATTAQLLLYIFGATVLGPLIYDRIDLVLGAMLLAAMLTLYRSRDGLFKLLIGCGIAFKLVPIVLVPMILAREWQKKADGTRSVPATLRPMLWTCLLLALPTLVSFNAVALLGGYRIDKLFAFHAARPIQIESGPATIEMILMMFGAEAHVREGYGSLNLISPTGDWLVAAGAVMLGIACIGSSAMVLRRRMGVDAFALLMAAVLAAAMEFSKVLSPQYFLFLLPVLVVLPVPRERTAAIANWLLIVAIFGLTGMIFPWWYEDLVALRTGAEFMVIVRNELFLILGVSLAWRAWKASVAPSGASRPSSPDYLPEVGVLANSNSPPFQLESQIPT